MLRHANRPLPLPFPAPQVEAVSPAAAAGSGKWVGESQAAELTAHRLDADAVLLRTTVFGPGTYRRGVGLGACRAGGPGRGAFLLTTRAVQRAATSLLSQPGAHPSHRGGLGSFTKFHLPVQS